MMGTRNTADRARQVRGLMAALGVIVLATVLATPASAQQSFPNRPVRMILPFPPGGSTDILGRIVSQSLTERLGVPVVNDNRPGLGGYLGMEIASHAVPDGHTIVMPITSFSINPHLYSSLPFDTVKDFAPVVLAASARLDSEGVVQMANVRVYQAGGPQTVILSVAKDRL